jgi:hypothetical protein
LGAPNGHYGISNFKVRRRICKRDVTLGDHILFRI